MSLSHVPAPDGCKIVPSIQLLVDCHQGAISSPNPESRRETAVPSTYGTEEPCAALLGKQAGTAVSAVLPSDMGLGAGS